jgi:quinol monooxygenase YgiN
MSQKILVTNFTFNVDRSEFERMVDELAPAFAEVPGCQWKIWTIDEKSRQAGAVYLFRNEAALEAFKASALVKTVLSHPALSNFELRERDILEGPSILTHAPLSVEAAMN